MQYLDCVPHLPIYMYQAVTRRLDRVHSACSEASGPPLIPHPTNTDTLRSGLDEQHVLTSSKLAEVGGHVAGHNLELQRLHDAQQRQGTTLEGVAKQVDGLSQVSMGFSQ